MPRKDIDYSRCIIYKIVCNDFNIKDLYVGHTTDLVKRRSHHRTNCNNMNNNSTYELKIYKVIRENGGWDNWGVVVIENYEACKNAEEARTRERYWFEILHANLNSVRPIRTLEEKTEYHKDYYENNKECILETNKQYYNNNKDCILLQKRENNKENYIIQKKKKLKNEYAKEYYLKNREKILNRQKEQTLKKLNALQV